MIAVIPAAGIGQRMGAALPKQYLQCLGSTLLDHTISALLAETRISKIYIALQSDDRWFEKSRYALNTKIQRVAGGETRAESVLNALSAAAETIPRSDLVVVHDAARPCLPLALLSHLLDVASANPTQGALLALPVRDTVKYAENLPTDDDASASRRLPTVLKTLNRDNVWLAQTPQVFRLGDLQRALSEATQQGVTVTDEASAMEAQGVEPILVRSSRRVMKVTEPEDLALIEFYLAKDEQKS